MKYFVTYAVMNSEIANPFWHAFILLSEAEENKKMTVVDDYGFYGLPSTERASLLSILKIKIGLDVDFEGNHGMWRHEATRDLDRGFGLLGTTFERTKKEFENIRVTFQKIIQEQEDAINEAVIALKLNPKPKSETRIYAYEHHGPEIFKYEIEKAQEENRLPRLKPFDFKLGFSIMGLDLTKSHTCKSQAIEVFDLSFDFFKNQIARLTENGKHPTIPRWSGPLEPFSLYSSGQLFKKETRRNGTVYSRDRNQSKVKLSWTSPPQEIESLDQQCTRLSEKNTARQVQSLISKLQRLEWVVINACLPEQYKDYENYRTELIKRTRKTYKAFAVPPTINNEAMITGSKGIMLFSRFDNKKNENEVVLLGYITNAKNFLNDLYFAIVDKWEIDSHYPMEHVLQVEEDENLINPVEALAAYLNEIDQKKICQILGRSYINEPRKMMSGF